MIYFIKSEKELETHKKIGELKKIVNEVRFQVRLVKQGFQHDAAELLKPNTKTVVDTSTKLLDQCKTTTEGIEEIKTDNQ